MLHTACSGAFGVEQIRGYTAVTQDCKEQHHMEGKTAEKKEKSAEARNQRQRQLGNVSEPEAFPEVLEERWVSWYIVLLDYFT